MSPVGSIYLVCAGHYLQLISPAISARQRHVRLFSLEPLEDLGRADYHAAVPDTIRQAELLNKHTKRRPETDAFKLDLDGRRQRPSHFLEGRNFYKFLRRGLME